MKVSKYQWGGPSPYLTQLAGKSTQEVLDDVKKTEPIQYAVPIYGTYLSWRDAVKDPSGTNIGLAALSTVGDIGSAFGVGELANLYVAGVKNAPKLAKATAAVDEGMKTYRAAEQAAINAAAQAQKAKQTVQAASLSGANQQVLSKYTRLANEAQTNARQAYNAAGVQASKLNGLTPKSNVTNISHTTAGANPGVFKETSVLPDNKDLFYIGPNYGGNTGLLGELNAAEHAMPREITKADKVYPGLMYFTGHAPAYLNAEGTKYVSEQKQGGQLNYLNYINDVGRTI